MTRVRVRRRVALIGTAVAVAAGLVTVGAGVAGAATTGPDSTCAQKLPTWVDGAPTATARSATGLYLGHDRIANGEHGYLLRVTHPAPGPAVYRFTVRIERTLHVRKLPSAAGDGWNVSADGHTLKLRLSPGARIDGVDFTTDCAVTMTVSGSLNGRALSLRQVFLGSGRVHPSTFPFTLRRH